MRRILILAALLLLVLQSSGWAQEREPLAMRITFEWTILGAIVGAGVGAALWLTDPGNPSNTLARSVTEGSAWGVAAGLGFSFFVMQRSALFPQSFAYSPNALDPSERLTADPSGAQAKREDLLASAQTVNQSGLALNLPIFNIRF